ncbi:LysR substrate-binding domain-containing protein [Variovorax sp. HJSM1_2]|uniref:LysR substrate-binding domain-containing protein n=1 Tax=Variovorax sp. HJSM1_2 TaxID=3366263 RepID=UPI003BCEECB9
MRRRCPTISELNAFISSARHLSFSKAAKELFVTQSAISRHIATLESYLGHALFIRGVNGLELTQIGGTYLKLVRPAMHSLEAATSQVMYTAPQSQSLNLSVAPTFAANWLFPRLNAFRAAHPLISINFVRYRTIDNMQVETDCDASIQYGYGDWPSAEATYLAGKETCVVCSPQYRDEQRIGDVEDLKRCVLLQHIELPLSWEDWFAAYVGGYESARFGPGFNLFSMLIQAAATGMGLALIPACLIERELASGELVEPLGRRFESPLGYYLCAPNSQTDLESYRLFGEWLRHESLHAAVDTSDGAACRYCGPT